jgi:hypothetical protein
MSPIHLAFMLAAVVISIAEPPPATAPEGSLAVHEESSTLQRPPGPTVGGRAVRNRDPLALVSSESLLSYLEELTSIGEDGLWRSSGSSGEVEARAWIRRTLEDMVNLNHMGLEITEQPFRINNATEAHTSRLFLPTGGAEVEIPTFALQGNRDWLPEAMRFDSDGVVNDLENDPLEISGPAIVVRNEQQLAALTPTGVAGRVLFVNFALIDRSILSFDTAIARAWELLELEPAAVVFITEFSNTQGVSHGSFVGDVSVMIWVTTGFDVPVLFARLEDFEEAQITSWTSLDQRAPSARLIWDEDVVSPGQSANLIARIPGHDSSLAMILGAHYDSPNTPGALDDGSGSVILLEIARVLSATWYRPEIDLYLVWFGSHERGVYGSANFVNAHSELLDRTLAMQQIDCLGHALDGYNSMVTLEGWSYGRHGDSSMPWVSFAAASAAQQGISTDTVDVWGLVSDNSNFTGLNVPNADLGYWNVYEMSEVHYDTHLHDPYDTVDLAALEASAFEQMARVALTAALDAMTQRPELRSTPEPDRRVVFVASHTEPPHMSPVGFTDFGMTFAWNGFDVDVIPYGQAVTAEDLLDASLVVVLPVIDYPTAESGPDPYDESWSASEIDVLEDYVSGGGLLMMTNTAHRLKYYNRLLDDNEDWSAMNDLSGRFGVQYLAGVINEDSAFPNWGHELVSGMMYLALAAGNTVRFTHDTGTVLVDYGREPVVVLVPHGDGEVIATGDVTILGANGGQPNNLPFWRNLAEYARAR